MTRLLQPSRWRDRSDYSAQCFSDRALICLNPNRQDRVIIDCDDNYRAERPLLGYGRFREVWAPRKRGS